MSDFHMPFVLFLSLPGLKEIIQCRAQLQMCSDSQEAFSLVLSGTPTEVMKNSQGLEYKFIHPQTVMLIFFSSKSSGKSKFQRVSGSGCFHNSLCLKTKCNEVYVSPLYCATTVNKN